MIKLLRIFALFAVMSFTLPASAEETVNINTADAETIAKVLNGVGTKKSQAVVEYRTKNGPFKEPKDITKVSGIGEATYEKNKDKIVVSDAGAGAADRGKDKEKAVGKESKDVVKDKDKASKEDKNTAKDKGKTSKDDTSKKKDAAAEKMDKKSEGASKNSGNSDKK